MRWSPSIRVAVARLLAVLFAAQVVAAGFCLLVPQAHAMEQMGVAPVTQPAASCVESVDAPAHMVGDHAHHAGACFHCSQPDMASSATAVELPTSPQMVALLVVAGVLSPVESAPSMVAANLHDPGDHAADRALLFHLIPRIRV